MNPIRRLRSILLLVALVATITASLTFSLLAQEETNLPPISFNTNSLGWAQALQQWGQAALSAAPTNLAVVPYATYAPSAPHKWGGGILTLWNITPYLGAGMGMDYLGSFSLVSGDVEVQAPIQPLSFLGSSLTNFTLTPFALGLAGTPVGGAGSANGSLATAAVVGGSFDPFTLFGSSSPTILGGKLALGGAYGNRFNAGDYSGKFFNFFIGWRRDF